MFRSPIRSRILCFMLKRLPSMTCPSIIRARCGCWQVADLMETNQRISTKVKNGVWRHSSGTSSWSRSYGESLRQLSSDTYIVFALRSLHAKLSDLFETYSLKLRFFSTAVTKNKRDNRLLR